MAQPTRANDGRDAVSGPGLTRAGQLGWAYEARPDLGRLESALARDYGFGPVRRLGILPAYRQGEAIIVWARPDLKWDSLLEAQAEFGAGFKPVFISADWFSRAVQRAFEGAGRAADAVQDLDDVINLEGIPGNLPENADLLDSQDDAPVIRLLNVVLAQAIEEGASDVHVEPFETRLVIRFRVDGLLRDVIEPPASLAGRVVARAKVMAKLNIAERRVPQDGRLSLRLAGRLIDVRVSTLPTHYGERVVMRILEKEQGALTLEQIGMSGDIKTQFTDLIGSPHGIFLVTGPTGSGKTTTLYAALQQVRTPDLNIITVEDPVEYDLEGVGQIPVNVRTGMTFDSGLRAILRQDPDVIMVGEIRDMETARVAVQASLTGHRVFSTLHTNDAAGSITRLIDMGIEPYLAASCMLGALAQRLVRKLCPQCRAARRPDATERHILGLETGQEALLHHPVGCEACLYTGYHGRTGVYELLVVDDALRALIHDNRGEQALREAAAQNGLRALREDGVAKALAGVTSLEEVLRVS